MDRHKMGIGSLVDKFITKLFANGEIIADYPLAEDLFGVKK
ncbi:hypothetical protein DJ66_0925 [Candidatus Liberibacter solanacearum]|uniref:Uncharacterized protein n=1 Tax=Candidatus Liberibacter solanacearum TaxID=556287 RepID=A0A0F4VLC5_9HYPH|nr:hypothetical protein [Candidatus Liberibacter solanacearum]KJZ82184.1 hypothetical protein DJ66_0925 [Candidatus Liberibacter solanacearum]